MAKAPLYYDQQRPTEDLEDAERTPVVQEMFSRKTPTPEDEYFWNEERSRSLDAVSAARPARTEPPQALPDEELGPFWRRIIRALMRMDTHWRP